MIAAAPVLKFSPTTFDGVNVRRSGDGFIRCSDGHVRWGVYGAAGVVFVWRDADNVDRVMLQLRSQFSHEGGTWSCAGGALDEGETPYQGALREASEEVGFAPDDHTVLGNYEFVPATDWTYTTIVIQVGAPFGESMNFETDAVMWTAVDAVSTLPLHAGFAAAWPHVHAIITADR